MKKILFVCSANKQRSKTADDYFSNKYPLIEFKSAGTNHKICNKEGTTPFTKDLIDWADTVFLMEQKHLKIVKSYLSKKDSRKMRVLDIPDDYKYYQSELLDLLDRKINFETYL